VSDEEEEEYAYDSDFDEDSPVKPSAAKGARMAVAMNHSDSYSFSFDDAALEENKGDDDRAAPAVLPKSAPATKTAAVPDAGVRARQLDEYVEHDFKHAAPLDPASQLRDRAKVLNPVRESLAHSLLASQVCSVFPRLHAHMCLQVIYDWECRIWLIVNYVHLLHFIGVIQEPAGVAACSDQRHEHLH
jgi:hypothetical protein